ncbi:MAG: PHP domain-containing protein [Ignavibacteria bacterium]|nr:PHP domain-containing protein [Ignavibacteria bacterium]
MQKTDLHIHTSFSDGKLLPAEILELAKSKGLEVISVTDHDNFEGSVAMLKYDGKDGLHVIPGIEISADFNGKEVHILGYFMDFKSKPLIEHLNFINNLRVKRFEKIIDKLIELGLNLKREHMLEKYSASNSVGRPHIANELVAQGLVPNFNTAFQKYLGDNKPAYVRKENLDYNVIIELIHNAGGLAFVAHPGNYFRESSLLKMKEAGIDGLETIHPSHTSNHVKKFTKFAEDNGMLTCGGSDFHGFHEEDYNNIGRYCVEMEAIKRMKKKLNLC